MKPFVLVVSEEGQWSDWRYAYSPFFVGVSGQFDATVRAEYSPDMGANTVEVDQFTEEDGRIFEVPRNGIWFRIGCAVGDYSAGPVTITVQG